MDSSPKDLQNFSSRHKEASAVPETVTGISEERHATVRALELAATLGHFERTLDSLESAESILFETAEKVKGLVGFHSMAFLLVNEQSLAFDLVWCSSDALRGAYETMRDGLISDNSFAWALTRNKPFVSSVSSDVIRQFSESRSAGDDSNGVLSDASSLQVMLHPLTSSAGPLGMFIGLLDEESREVADIGYYLLTVVLFSAATMLENFMLYRKLARSHDDLEILVQERTRALTDSNAHLQREVVERRQAEQALRTTLEEKEAYRQNLEAVFTSMQDAILTVDRERRLISMNRAGEQFSGKSEAEAVGHPFAEILPDCAEPCTQVFERTLEFGQSVREFRAQCRIEGKEKVLTLSCSPLITKEGIFTGAVLIVRDITRLDTLERELRERHAFRNIIGKSQPMQEVYQLLENLADVDSTVLVVGESGTGKELVAEALHHNGARSGGPLIKVNCTALSENLLESELFGHVRGAFTGAVRDKAGRFEAAEGGTIFLDEIGDISMRIQVLLLRFLESKEFERVGDTKTRQADVRIVAATNADLPRKIREGVFRADLFYRLNVMNVSLPPLRQRLDDIPLLTQHLIEQCNESLGTHVSGVSEDAMSILLQHSWPGNVRELKHSLEHGCVLVREGTLDVKHLMPNVRNSAGSHELQERVGMSEGAPEARQEGAFFTNMPRFAPQSGAIPSGGDGGASVPVGHKTFNEYRDMGAQGYGVSPLWSGESSSHVVSVCARQHVLTADILLAAIAQSGGNKTRAAQLLGIGRATLYRKLQEFGVST